MSFKRKAKASVKYKPNESPTVTNEIYTKNKRTFVTLMPNLSANLVETAKPWRSK